jgi:Sulfotransferase family
MREPQTPVWVGGINRSGTTLMARILGSSSALAVPPSEFLFFGRRAAAEPADRVEFERRLAEILRWPRVREWGLDDREVIAHSRSWPATARSLFLLPLEAYRARTGKPRLGEKSVLNEFRLDALRAWLGDFRLVQMIRHPVAAYASSHAGQSPDLRRAMRWGRVWSASAEIGLTCGRSEPGRHRLVRYEDLTVDPRATVAGVADFLGLAFEEEAMLGLAAYESKENSSFAVDSTGTYEHAIRRSDGVDRAAAVHPSERAVLAAVCGPAARELGYAIEAPRRPVAVTVARLLEDARPRRRLRALLATLT